MIASPSATRQHHARLQPNVDRLASTAALVGTSQDDELRSGLDEACSFLTGLLLPHMEATERVLFPELERLMQNRHSMTPMRREHQLIRDLVADLEHSRVALAAGPLSTGASLGLRRVLYRLHGILRVHLAEEQLYAHLVERGMTDAEKAALADALEHPGIATF